MSLNPKVSVCMITYGHEKYIRQAIEGVLMQECDFDIELIIANDASPDTTDEIVQSLIKSHPQGSWIKYIKHEKNIGMMSNFIYALQQCKGKYIALCEGDDYWTDPLKSQKQVGFLESNSDFAFCITNLDLFNQITGMYKKKILSTDVHPLYLSIDDFLLNKGYMGPCTWLGRRECFFITKQNEIRTDGTFAFFMDILQNTKVKFINQSTAVYRILPESAARSNSIIKYYIYQKGVYNTQLSYIEKYKLYHLLDLVKKKHFDMIIDILKKNYLSIDLPEMVKLLKDDFTNEDYNFLIFEMTNFYQKKMINILNSKSYFIGRLILKPIVFLRNKFSK